MTSLQMRPGGESKSMGCRWAFTLAKARTVSTSSGPNSKHKMRAWKYPWLPDGWDEFLISRTEPPRKGYWHHPSPLLFGAKRWRTASSKVVLERQISSTRSKLSLNSGPIPCAGHAQDGGTGNTTALPATCQDALFAQTSTG